MPEHSFSNTMVLIPGWHAHAMLRMGRKIPDKHLADDGRENEPHITVKYGSDQNTPPDKLRRALAGFGPVRATFGKTSLFKNDDAHVVKIDIESPDLHRLNALIGKAIATPGSTHPEYKPHATIAYVKPGFSAAYDGDHTLSGQTVEFDNLVFSGKDDRRHVIPLTKGKSS
jgi:2'-5' RNA ligase